MDRKSFLQTCSLCACTGIASAVLNQSANAEEAKQEDWRIGHMQRWAAEVVNHIDENVDEKTRAKILEACGRSCSQSSLHSVIQFKGHLEDFLAESKKRWKMESLLSKDKTQLTFIGNKAAQCVCPLGKNPPMRSTCFCNCSNGWMKETLEMITGKKVDVELKRSIIRGDGQCEWELSFS